MNLLVDGYLIPGAIQWTRGSSISVVVDAMGDDPHVCFRYTTGGKDLDYRVRLASMAPNLGSGVIWFFVCPVSGLRCRKLYMVNGYFVHRMAYDRCIYDSQAQSKNSRSFDKLVLPLFRIDRMEEETRKPYYKKYYNGVPTRSYRRVLKMRQKANRVTRAKFDEAFSRIF